MAECPRCKEDMPLLSRICKVCGFVAENNEQSMTAAEFAGILEDHLHRLKTIPRPTFGKSMQHLGYVIFPFLAFICFIFAVTDGGMAAWIFLILFGGLSWYYIRRRTKGNLGNGRFNSDFRRARQDFEKDKRIAARSFGNDREVSELLNEISAEIDKLEKERRKANLVYTIIWIIVAVILTLLIVLASRSDDSGTEAISDQKLEQMTLQEKLPVLMKAERFNEAVDAYAASEYNNDYDGEKFRMEIIDAMVTAGRMDDAKNFFSDYCAGTVGDYNCALRIVKGYAEQDNKEEARNFIEGSSGELRYASDRKKLSEQVNR